MNQISEPTGAGSIDGADSIDLVELTVEQVQAGFASGAFTSESLTQAFLDRIAIYNAHYNAIVFLNPDALADARAVDRRRAAGESLGPLAGVPVVVKDAMDMVGFPDHRRLVAAAQPDGRRRPAPGHRRAGRGPHAGRRHHHPGQDQHPGAQRHRQPRQRQLGRPHLQRGRARVPAGRQQRRHRDGGRGEPRGAGPRRGDRRIDPEPRGGARAGRHQADLRSRAERGRAAAVGPARRRRADRPLRSRRRPHPRRPGRLHDRGSEDDRGRRPSARRRLHGAADAGCAAGQAHRHLRSGMAQHAPVPRRRGPSTPAPATR